MLFGIVVAFTTFTLRGDNTPAEASGPRVRGRQPAGSEARTQCPAGVSGRRAPAARPRMLARLSGGAVPTPPPRGRGLSPSSLARRGSRPGGRLRWSPRRGTRGPSLALSRFGSPRSAQRSRGATSCPRIRASALGRAFVLPVFQGDPGLGVFFTESEPPGRRASGGSVRRPVGLVRLPPTPASAPGYPGSTAGSPGYLPSTLSSPGGSRRGPRASNLPSVGSPGHPGGLLRRSLRPAVSRRPVLFRDGSEPGSEPGSLPPAAEA